MDTEKSKEVKQKSSSSSPTTSKRGFSQIAKEGAEEARRTFEQEDESLSLKKQKVHSAIIKNG